ncbi:MAG: MerR family transcriptional regulator, partial [Microbacteriaceae bacterium]
MDMDIDSPIFTITSAAELSAMHPQTLRQYDRLGIVSPHRTSGRSRRYSLRDIGKLKQVAELGTEGVSLEGIRRIIELEDTLNEMRNRVRELEQLLADEVLRRPGNRVFAAGTHGNV